MTHLKNLALFAFIALATAMFVMAVKISLPGVPGPAFDVAVACFVLLVILSAVFDHLRH